MAVHRFDGMGCWQQHLQIVQAIVKSNGWSEGTAVLQLFAHLEGEALDVALLMPKGEGEMGGPIEWSFRILQFSGETSGSPAAIRERDSPAGNGSSYVHHRAGYPRGAGIWRHGQACPGCDDQR